MTTPIKKLPPEELESFNGPTGSFLSQEIVSRLLQAYRDLEAENGELREANMFLGTKADTTATELRHLKEDCDQLKRAIASVLPQQRMHEFVQKLDNAGMGKQTGRGNTVTDMITELVEERDQLKAENEELKKQNGGISIVCKENEQLRAAAGFCEKHKPDGGSRNCLVCGCEELSHALSKISYICGAPNEMGVSEYDTHCNPAEVIKQVEQSKSRHDTLVERSVAAMDIADGDDYPESMATECPMLTSVVALRKERDQLRAQLEELKTNFIKFTELPAGDARITGQKLDSCERQCKRQEDEIDQLHAQVSEMRFILTIFKTVHEDCGRPSLTPIGRDRFEMIYRALRGETNLVTPNQTILEWIGHVQGKAETLFFEAKGMMPNPDIHIWSSTERTKFVTLTDIIGEINTYSAAIKEKLEKAK